MYFSKSLCYTRKRIYSGQKTVANIFYKDKPIVGLDISKASMRIVSVDRHKMLVHGYGSIDLDPQKNDSDTGDNADYLAEKIREMFKNNIEGRIDSNRIALGIPTGRTFSRTFSLPVKEEKNIRNAVNLEAEQYIPIPLDSLYVDYEIVNRTKEEITVLMCAAPKLLVDNVLEAARQCDLEIALIEPDVNAIARLLKRTEEGMLPTIIVDIDLATTDIAILDSAIRVTGGLSVGGHTLTLDLAKKMNITVETAHQFKVLNGLNPGPRQARITAALQPSLLKITNEVKKVMRYYTDRFPDERRIEQVLIVGSGSSLPGIGEFFTNELVMPARVASPWQSLNFGDLKQPSKQLRPRFITAAGLALIKQEDLYG